MPPGNPVTRGKGDLARMSMCYPVLSYDVGGPPLCGGEEAKKSQCACTRQRRRATPRSRQCSVRSGTPMQKGRGGGYLLSSNPGKEGTCRMRMLLRLREWRPVKEHDVPRATQPGPWFWAPEALCTDVQPTQHLSCFLGIAGSVTHHSSQLQGTLFCLSRTPSTWHRVCRGLVHVC